METSKQQSQKIAILAIFTAITVVLQFLSYFVRIGTFNLSLVLIPIVLAGVLYGPRYGAFLGAAFGIVTVIGCITAFDVGGNILFNASPALTVLICMLKATLCGLAAGLVGKALYQVSPTLAVFAAAVTAPVVNTGLFIIMALIFFRDILYTWAGGTNLLNYVIFGLIGVNFLIELGLNLIFSPSIFRVIKAVKKL